MRALSAASREDGGDAIVRLAVRYERDLLATGELRQERREEAARGSNVREEFIAELCGSNDGICNAERFLESCQMQPVRGTE